MDPQQDWISFVISYDNMSTALTFQKISRPAIFDVHLSGNRVCKASQVLCLALDSSLKCLWLGRLSYLLAGVKQCKSTSRKNPHAKLQDVERLPIKRIRSPL